MFLLLFVFNSNCNQWVEKLLFSIRDLAFFNLKSIIRHKKENIWLPGLRRSGFTRPLRYQRVEEHKNSSSSIAKYFREKHCLTPKDLEKNFKSKFNCLVYEVFFIDKLRPSLNVQFDSIRAKVFNWWEFCMLLLFLTPYIFTSLMSLPIYIYILCATVYIYIYVYILYVNFYLHHVLENDWRTVETSIVYFCPYFLAWIVLKNPYI